MTSKPGLPSWTTVPCVNPREAPLIGSGHAWAERKGSLYIFGGETVPKGGTMMLCLLGWTERLTMFEW
jgi:hypothetical protein